MAWFFDCGELWRSLKHSIMTLQREIADNLKMTLVSYKNDKETIISRERGALRSNRGALRSNRLKNWTGLRYGRNWYIIGQPPRKSPPACTARWCGTNGIRSNELVTHGAPLWSEKVFYKVRVRKTPSRVRAARSCLSIVEKQGNRQWMGLKCPTLKINTC